MANTIYYVNNKKYAIPDSILATFQSKYPDAELGIEYMVGDKHIAIPSSREAALLAKYPNASLASKILRVIISSSECRF